MATLEQSHTVSISDLLSEDVIGPELEVSDRDEVFVELVNLLEDAERISQPDEALEAIREREDILSTGIGNGVAIPHAKSETVSSLVAALGRVPNGVDFQSLDGKPAHLIFLLLSPKNEAGLHVRALARVSRMLKNAQFREKLLEANAADEILDLIREEEQSR